MKNPKISIIVPIYNSEHYLSDCIESIISQSFCDFELLLIDDGSVDNSAEICKSFSKEDKRVHYYYKSNSGVSDTRNYGINIAKGDFLCFIDSDDTIDDDYFDNFHFCNIKADLYIQGYKRYLNNNLINSTAVFSGNNKKKEDILAYAEKNSIINSPWGKLFKSDIIKSNNIHFDIGTSFGEDHLFVLEYIIRATTIYLSDTNGYNYQIRGSESLTGRNVPSKEVIYYANKMSELHGLILNKYNSTKLKEAFSYSYYYNYIRALRYYFHSNKDLNCYSYINNSFHFDYSYKTIKSIGYKGFIFLLLVKILPCGFSHMLLRYIFV